jgi:hypothetical protein
MVAVVTGLLIVKQTSYLAPIGTSETKIEKREEGVKCVKGYEVCWITGAIGHIF